MVNIFNQAQVFPNNVDAKTSDGKVIEGGFKSEVQHLQTP
jgi:hypothetical protein